MENMEMWMDANKSVKLRDIGYTIPVVCGLCRHGKFQSGNDFGDCAVKTYVHLKHTAGEKPLSVSKFGKCPDAVVDEAKASTLHGFREFVDRHR